MIDSSLNDTQGKVLPGLSISQLNDKIISKMDALNFVQSIDPILFESKCSTDRYQEYDVNISNQICFYTKDEKLSIVTSAVMDIGYKDDDLGHRYPSLEELIKSLKENKGDENIVETVKSLYESNTIISTKPIPIYIPLASKYKDILTISHAHFRGILLEAGLNEKGDFGIYNATLIDSRGPIFGRNAPSSIVKKTYCKIFPQN